MNKYSKWYILIMFILTTLMLIGFIITPIKWDFSKYLFATMIVNMGYGACFITYWIKKL